MDSGMKAKAQQARDDDSYPNLLDWGSHDVLATALGATVYLCSRSSGSTRNLVTVDAPVTCINWSPDGRHLAVGLNSSHVLIWDTASSSLIRSLLYGHRSRILCLAWNNQILTTGGLDGQIINNDVRIKSHVVETYSGHTREVCALKWSASGQMLASGGHDDVVYVWDRSVPTQWLHRLEVEDAVKALAWCPFQAKLLATGGGRTVKFWHTVTGACLNTLETGSDVSCLLWSKHRRELLSSHQNRLILWNYPSLVKKTEFIARLLYTAQSPDGSTVATAAEGGTLEFRNVFGAPKSASSYVRHPVPFSHVRHFR